VISTPARGWGVRRFESGWADDASCAPRFELDLMTMADYLVSHEWSVWCRPERPHLKNRSPWQTATGTGLVGSWVLFMTRRHGCAWVAADQPIKPSGTAIWTEDHGHVRAPFLEVDQNGPNQSPTQCLQFTNLTMARLTKTPAGNGSAVRDYFLAMFPMETTAQPRMMASAYLRRFT